VRPNDQFFGLANLALTMQAKKISSWKLYFKI
jgi:hypothetical protein